jgi:hypothetical protein
VTACSPRLRKILLLVSKRHNGLYVWAMLNDYSNNLTILIIQVKKKDGDDGSQAGNMYTLQLHRRQSTNKY